MLSITYYVAMVYDGVTLKFYRNGFLMSQVAATGDLYQNDWPTRIGYYFSEIYNTNFIGYINEVRIWNVARTQAQLQTYMNVPLPNPTTQAGLLAYYTFDDLLNKQGNAAWNGVLVGSAVINQTNPTCAGFIADSCCVTPQGTLTGSNICLGNTATLTFNAAAGTAPFTLTYSDGTNTYTQNNVQSNVPFPVSTQPLINTTYTLLSIKDATICPAAIVTGTTAIITVNNCSLCKGSLGDPVVNITFGSGDNPGQTLPAIVSGASTTLTYVAVTGNPAMPTPLDGQYTITNNVPTNPSWFSGAADHTPNVVNGYMAFYNASEQPGEFYNQAVNNLCGSTTYEFAAWIANALNPAITMGVNPNITFTIEQTDGTILAAYNTGDITQTPAFTWNQYGFFFTTPSTVSTVVLRMINNSPGGTANVGNDLAIDDITFRPCGPVTTASFNPTTISDSIAVCAGSDTTIYGTVSTGYNTPAYVWQVSKDSGKTWVDIPNSNNLTLPVTTIATGSSISYKYRMMTGESTNIGSLNCRVASNLVTLVLNIPAQAQLTGGNICIGQDGILLFTSTGGTAPFNIKYGNGINTYTLGNVINNMAFTIPYALTDTTTFTLITVADANGCVDSANNTAIVNVQPLPQGGIAGFNAVCAGDSALISFVAVTGAAPFQVVIFDGSNTTTYYGIRPGVPFTIAPVNTTSTISLVSVTDQDGNGCTRTTGFISPDVVIAVNAAPQIQFDSLGGACIDKSPFLIDQAKEISGIAGAGFFSGDGVDPEGNFSPSLAGLGNHTITYTYMGNDGCSASKSQDIVVNADPVANAGSDLISCMGVGVQLSASGGQNYLWSPPAGLSDPTVPNPVVNINATTTYTVVVTDSNGCTATDSATVVVSLVGKAIYIVPNAFTPNGDGKNDCFGIQHWGGVELEQFSIFNRWGQRVFFTKNPSECWDGTFNGTRQDAGTFVYMIQAKTPCGDVSLKGTVILIR